MSEHPTLDIPSKDDIAVRMIQSPRHRNIPLVSRQRLLHILLSVVCTSPALVSGCSQNGTDKFDQVQTVPLGEKKKEPAFKVLLQCDDLQGSRRKAVEMLPLVLAEIKEDAPEKDFSEVLLGSPLPYCWVRLDELVHRAPGSDPRLLLQQRPLKMIFPVQSPAAEILCSLDITQKKKEWKLTAFGSRNLANKAFRTREAHAQEFQIPPHSYMVVEIPALQHYFLGLERSSGVLELIPILDIEQTDLKAGRMFTADEVFEKLRSSAIEKEKE